MTKDQRRFRPEVAELEVKLALSQVVPVSAPAASSVVQNTVSQQNTYATLAEFTLHYPSLFGQPNYDPAFDLNHNGRVGQTDGKVLLRSLPPLSKKVPISINLWVAPQDRVNGHHPTNSGGVSHSRITTILGHTTPGALVFTGTGTEDFKLKGPAVVANAQGNFTYKFYLYGGINQLDFQAVDPYGQQITRSFPIYWTTYRAFAMKHPVND